MPTSKYIWHPGALPHLGRLQPNGPWRKRTKCLHPRGRPGQTARECHWSDRRFELLLPSFHQLIDQLGLGRRGILKILSRRLNRLIRPTHRPRNLRCLFQYVHQVTLVGGENLVPQFARASKAAIRRSRISLVVPGRFTKSGAFAITKLLRVIQLHRYCVLARAGRCKCQAWDTADSALRPMMLPLLRLRQRRFE